VILNYGEMVWTFFSNGSELRPIWGAFLTCDERTVPRKSGEVHGEFY
jgi:hypothetical protein